MADNDPTTSEPTSTQLTCPRCGSARSKSASFCGVCGQDLRPGALVVPARPAEATSAAPEAGKRRLGLRRAKSDQQADGAAAAAAAPGAGAPAPTPATAPPITLPGSTTPLPRETPAPKPITAVAAKEDTSLSFSERYRGTQYSNPDIERFLPPPTRARSGRRWPAMLAAAVILVVLVAGLVGGSWLLVLAPNALVGTAATTTDFAAASATPRPTAQATPTVHGLVADEAEIVACRLAGEVADQGAGLDAIRADVAAGTIDGLAARIDAVTAAMALSAADLPALEAVPQTAELAAAYRTLYDQADAAFVAVKAAEPTAKALKQTLKPLDAARKSYEAVLALQQAFVDTYPEASCVIVP